MDICPDKKQLDDFLFPDPALLLNRLTMTTGPRFRALNKAVVSLLDEFSLVNFVPLDITDEESIAEVLYAVDSSIHYGEDADVKMRDEPEGDGMDEGNECDGE